jgi:hypothetical protein
MRARNGGERPEAAHMFGERGFFNTKPSDATTFPWKPYRMNRPIPNKSGQRSRNGEIFLEAHSHTDDTPNSRAILEGQLRECYGRVVYSHKTHEKCADILLSRLSKIKVSQIVLSALTTAGFIGVVLGSGEFGALAGVVVSTALLAVNAYTKNYDLGELAQKHKQAGVDLWIIREKYLSLLVDLAMGEKPLEALQAERDKLVEQLHTVYSGAPSTTFQAYKKAQEALQQLEDMTFSDAEIDAFLPQQLKRRQ